MVFLSERFQDFGDAAAVRSAESIVREQDAVAGPHRHFPAQDFLVFIAAHSYDTHCPTNFGGNLQGFFHRIVVPFVDGIDQVVTLISFPAPLSSISFSEVSGTRFTQTRMSMLTSPQ